MPTFAGFAKMVITLTHGEDVGDEYNVTYLVGQDPSAPEQEQVNDNCALFGSAWAQHLDTQVTIVRCTGYFGNTPPADDNIFVSTTLARPGERNVTSLPQNCATLIKKNTGLGGRRNRGRCYFPFLLAESDVNEGGQILSSRILALQDTADFWLDELASDTGSFPAATPMFLEHRDPNGGLGPIPTPVISLVVDPLLATQRRRLRR